MLFQRYCFFPEDFSGMLDLVVFPAQQLFNYFSPTLVNISMNSLCVQMFLSCFFRNMDFAYLFFQPDFFPIDHAQMLFFLCIHQFVFFS